MSHPSTVQDASAAGEHAAAQHAARWEGGTDDGQQVIPQDDGGGLPDPRMERLAPPGTESSTGVDRPAQEFQEQIDSEIIHWMARNHDGEGHEAVPGTRSDRGTDDGQQVIPQDDGGGLPDPRMERSELDFSSMATLLENLDLDELASGLDLDEVRRVVDQAKALLESFYVHLPFKRALHGVDPVQKLSILRRRLEDAAAPEFPAPLELHREMTRIFASVCDRHTTYLLPSPLCEKLVFLGVKVEDCYDDSGQRRYLISHRDKNLARRARGRDRDSFLVPADQRRKRVLEVVSWNGIPIRRAVELNADHHAGSNPAARHARGLTRLTLRPLRVSLPPDESAVTIGYRVLKPGRNQGTLGDPRRSSCPIQEVVLPWRVIDQPPVQAVVEECQRQAWGLDAEGDAVHQLSRLLFTQVAGEGSRSIRRAFRSREVCGGRVGYLRIFSFNADPGELVEEFLRRLRSLPQEGLILDVRGNSGGSICAAERMLQFLTPRAIEPARFQLRNTPAIRELCRKHSPSQLYPGLDLEPWLESLEQAARTGAEYSRSFPITSVRSCNAIGQRYHGPVVLITDALSYSATDIFAAGFQDHGIGPIVGVDGRTGGGGANIFGHELLCALAGEAGSAGGSPLATLPRNLSMNVAFRRALRVAGRAGMPLESFGVEPDCAYRMTYRDLLRDNEDLIALAAEKLEQQPARKLAADVRWRDGHLEVAHLETLGIERLDVYVDERPLGSIDPATDATQLTGVNGEPSVVELRGYELDGSPCEPGEGVGRFLPGARNDRLVAHRKLWVPVKSVI